MFIPGTMSPLAFGAGAQVRGFQTQSLAAAHMAARRSHTELDQPMSGCGVDLP
jgi:hypothetical protein